jgi:succinyl-CoA synthetase alpha subunit
MGESTVSIFVNKDTRVVVQGITGKEGQFHTRNCAAYGTQVVAGVTPGKAGQTVDAIPVFNTVADAVRQTGADCSLIFVPPPFAADAILEAADAGIRLVVAITEGSLDLGPWEQIFYGEFDGRRKKRVLVKIVGE